jgi:hypothetical protein
MTLPLNGNDLRRRIRCIFGLGHNPHGPCAGIEIMGFAEPPKIDDQTKSWSASDKG